MMTSSNGNIFRVTGRLCGEFTGHRWIPRTKASDTELWCFLWFVWINGWENNRDLRRYRAHYDVIVMCHSAKRNGSNEELYEFIFPRYCSDVIMSAKASQITSVTIVWSTGFFGRRSKKTTKLRVAGLCEGIPSVTGGFPSQRASNAENVSIWRGRCFQFDLAITRHRNEYLRLLIINTANENNLKKNLDYGCIVCIYFFVFSTEIEFVQYEYFFYTISIAWQEMVR